MTNLGLGLPLDIPWRVIAASPDMMDEKFCNKAYPFAWHSSLAISMFQPKAEELPSQLCGQRLTYLKVTASITGYEPTEEETRTGYASFPNTPKEDLDAVLRNYFACYGALLNVAVFPGPESGQVSTLVSTDVDFADEETGGEVDNPLVVEEIAFQRTGEANEIVDLYPAGGDGRGELSLGRELEVTFPAATRVVARVVTFAEPVSITAFRDDDLVDDAETGPEQDRIHELTVEAEGITRVVLTAPQDEASLLSLSVWRREGRDATLADYPHIIDFEPKLRDLYQAATKNGELLSASTSEVKVNKTMAHTESTETGVEHAGKYTSPQSPYGQFEASHKISHKWGETDSDTSSVTADASRDRRERVGSSTNLVQMYNLLTGYHSGTNRALFLMLPRPHVLQPTDRRTFVRGLRVIEGIQEFFLVVTHDAQMEGLCIDVHLDTGHFPESVTVETPPVRYQDRTEQFHVSAYAKGGGGITGQGADTVAIESVPSATYNASSGWVIDKTKGDAGHPGVHEVGDQSNQQAINSLRGYNYQAPSDASVVVSGNISGANWWGPGAVFERDYEVFLRSEQPIPSSEEPAVKTGLLITGRDLCVCYRLLDGCPEVVDEENPATKQRGTWIVEEPEISLQPAAAPESVATEALLQVQNALSSSWRMPTRRPPGAVGFLESDYFTSRIGDYLPPDLQERPVSELPDAGELTPALREVTVRRLLAEDLAGLSATTGVEVGELARLRRRVFES
ncbi:hypothetical protein GCM10009744_65130 [Kribbella alba]|uniref:Uncharacterized protein n=1 Tax=Kribbella alba TaxID=190197 RepID=A0ABN2FYZ4_9ACTN